MSDLISCELNNVVKQSLFKCWFTNTRHITYLTVGKNSSSTYFVCVKYVTHYSESCALSSCSVYSYVTLCAGFDGMFMMSEYHTVSD
jgi:hypothetical protein